MTVLRIYEPNECTSDGTPFDWETCRSCGGLEEGIARQMAREALCPVCIGHGSLKWAALGMLLNEAWKRSTGKPAHLPRTDAPPPSVHRAGSGFDRFARCEDCGHPMNEGTWTYVGHSDYAPNQNERLYAEEVAGAMLRAGDQPRDQIEHNVVHYSPCDVECDHGDGEHLRITDRGGTTSMESGSELKRWLTDPDVATVEASWRPVDVRTLGWRHDLRPERLAILCLRCLAARLAAPERREPRRGTGLSTAFFPLANVNQRRVPASRR